MLSVANEEKSVCSHGKENHQPTKKTHKYNKKLLVKADDTRIDSDKNVQRVSSCREKMLAEVENAKMNIDKKVEKCDTVDVKTKCAEKTIVLSSSARNDVLLENIDTETKDSKPQPNGLPKKITDKITNNKTVLRIDCGEVTSAQLHQIGICFPDLAVLSVSHWTTITSSRPLVSFKNLKSLNLTGHKSLTLGDFEGVVREGCMLTTLRLNDSNIDWQILQVITTHCLSLQELALADTRQLALHAKDRNTQAALTSIALLADLRTLSLDSVPLSDATLLPIITGCKLLRSLSLANCQLSGSQVEALARPVALSQEPKDPDGSPPPGLRHLRLLNLSHNTAPSFTSALPSLVSLHLKYLFLDGCPVQDRVIVDLVRGLVRGPGRGLEARALRILSLSCQRGNGRLTDKCVDDLITILAVPTVPTVPTVQSSPVPLQLFVEGQALSAEAKDRLRLACSHVVILGEDLKRNRNQRYCFPAKLFCSGSEDEWESRQLRIRLGSPALSPDGPKKASEPAIGKAASGTSLTTARARYLHFEADWSGIFLALDPSASPAAFFPASPLLRTLLSFYPPFSLLELKPPAFSFPRSHKTLSSPILIASPIIINQR